MKRRLIPPGFAIFVALASLLPLFVDWFTEREETIISLSIAVFVFAFQAALSAYMRWRMTVGHAKLTIFGRSIVDYFSSLVVFALIMCGVFGTLLILTAGFDWGNPPPQWLTLANRAAINGGGGLILATGAAVWFEMGRSDDLEVHAERYSRATRTETTGVS